MSEIEKERERVTARDLKLNTIALKVALSINVAMTLN